MDDIYRFLAWYLALSVASMLGLPLARRCLGVLPDQGVTFACTFTIKVLWIVNMFSRFQKTFAEKFRSQQQAIRKRLKRANSLLGTFL